jgi:hypothetical protein
MDRKAKTLFCAEGFVLVLLQEERGTHFSSSFSLLQLSSPSFVHFDVWVFGQQDNTPAGMIPLEFYGIRKITIPENTLILRRLFLGFESTKADCYNLFSPEDARELDQWYNILKPKVKYLFCFWPNRFLLLTV